MAQWHVAELTPSGLNIVVHFLVPAGNNSAGVAWKSAALKAGYIGKAASGWADANEVAAIAAGDTAEVTLLATIDGSKPLKQQAAAVQAQVMAHIAKIKAEWQATLALAGYGTGTVI